MAASTRTPKVWHGSPDLAKKLVAVGDLTPHPRNRRRGDPERISRSLDNFGQLKPVVVNSDNVILAGHHVVQAARSIGWTHVAVAVTDLDEHEALTFLIADNRLSDIATWDDAGLLTDLDEIGLDSALIAGYEPHEIEALIEQVATDAAASPDLPPGDGGSLLTCPHCGEQFRT